MSDESTGEEPVVAVDLFNGAVDGEVTRTLTGSPGRGRNLDIPAVLTGVDLWNAQQTGDLAPTVSEAAGTAGNRGPAVLTVRTAQTGANGHGISTEVTPTLDETGAGAVLALSENQRAEVRLTEVSRQLTAGGGKPGQGYPSVVTGLPPPSAPTASLTPTLCAEGSPVRTSAWRESVLGWLASGPAYGTSSVASLLKSLPVGFSSRTSLACCPPAAAISAALTSPPSSAPASTQPQLPGISTPGTRSSARPRRATTIGAGTSRSSWRGWSNSGMAWPGGSLTLSTSEWPSDAAVCSLSDVLETGPHLRRYSLSPRAAAGILRRAAKRGKLLPAPLAAALVSVAGPPTPSA